MKIFLSHTQKNETYALKFKHLLESLSVDIEVFCSSEKGSIPVGADFHKTIFSELKSSDIFVSLISREYFESKYCMIELGVAFCYSQDNINERSEEYIFPFILPPLTKSAALAGTPLANLQAAEINNKNDLLDFINYIREVYNINTMAGVNPKLHSFSFEIDQLILKGQDIFKLANVLTCCNMNDVPDNIREDEIIRHSFIDNAISVSYNLNPKELPDVKRTSFISLVLKYVDGINLRRYLEFNSNSNMEFTLNNFTNSLKGIFVEFKYTNQAILKKFEFPLKSGDNTISIPMSSMDSNALSNITEICFVAHPTDVVEDEGTYKISDIKIT